MGLYASSTVGVDHDQAHTSHRECRIWGVSIPSASSYML